MDANNTLKNIFAFLRY